MWFLFVCFYIITVTQAWLLFIQENCLSVVEQVGHKSCMDLGPG